MKYFVLATLIMISHASQLSFEEQSLIARHQIPSDVKEELDTVRPHIDAINSPLWIVPRVQHFTFFSGFFIKQNTRSRIIGLDLLTKYFEKMITRL